MRRTLAGGVVLAAGWAWAATPSAARHVRASLVSEAEWIRPGEPFHVGLLLEMDPEWHTYWKNPGDAGLPTRLAWTLPEGLAAGPIEWPYPRRFGASVVSYGYADQVLLLARVTPDASLAGASVRLAARADWLECKEACFPGRAQLSLTLPVKAAPPAPSSQAALFRDARSRLPEEPAGWSLSSAATARRLALSLRPPRGVGLRSAYFFPEERGRLDHAAPQAFGRAKDGYRLLLTPDPNATLPLPETPGVLVAETESGAPRALRLRLGPGAASTTTTRKGGPPPVQEERP